MKPLGACPELEDDVVVILSLVDSLPIVNEQCRFNSW